MTTQNPDANACSDCGVTGVPGVEGCRALFQEVCGREFSHAALFQVHRMTVDAYCLQHPDPYLRSAKSMASHLAGMCLALEHDGGPGMSRLLSAWLDGHRDLTRPDPPPPGRRGRLTVRSVHETTDPEDHRKAVKEWAESVWNAWSEHHDQARRWAGEVLAGAGR